MLSGLPNCLLSFQSIVSPCTFWFAVLNKNYHSAVMTMCMPVIYPYFSAFYLHKSWNYCLMSLESEHYLLEDCLCLLKHVDLSRQSEVQAMLVKIVLCWMSVIHSQNMKHDKLRGKISKTLSQVEATFKKRHFSTSFKYLLCRSWAELHLSYLCWI